MEQTWKPYFENRRKLKEYQANYVRAAAFGRRSPLREPAFVCLGRVFPERC